MEPIRHTLSILGHIVSKSDKEVFIRAHRDELMDKIFRDADSRRRYGFRKFKMPNSSIQGELTVDKNYNTFSEVLGYLEKSSISRSRKREFFEYTLENFIAADRDLLVGIFRGDLGIGVSKSQYNTIIGKNFVTFH